jgi:HD-GYP domain-containing protein (c-di-GMP phosphodiesterase class II)
MGLDERKVEEIRCAAMLHDIGKIGLALESLNKPGRLTREEEAVFRTHPRMGCKILGPIRFFENLIPIIYHHHERYDGKGYPEGKAGEKIPLGARILAVADAFDAMTSDRSYREAMKEKDAVRELCNHSGSQFDPIVVETFVEIVRRRAAELHPLDLPAPAPATRPA